MELATRCISHIHVPLIIAHGSPNSIMKDLHAALSVIFTTNQPNTTFLIT